MDLFTVLQDDHRQVMAMLDQMALTDEMSVRRRKQVAQQLQDALLPHMAAEETIMYPLLQTREEDDRLYKEANEDHHEARIVLNDILGMAVADPLIVDQCAQLREVLAQHIQEEESIIFDEIRRIVIQENGLVELGRQFQEFKAQCLNPRGQTNRPAA